MLWMATLKGPVGEGAATSAAVNVLIAAAELQRLEALVAFPYNRTRRVAGGAETWYLDGGDGQLAGGLLSFEELALVLCQAVRRHDLVHRL